MSEKKPVFRNLVVNIISMLSQFLIGPGFGRYLVKHVGLATCGFGPFASVLVAYFASITGTVIQGISRSFIQNMQAEN